MTAAPSSLRGTAVGTAYVGDLDRETSEVELYRLFSKVHGKEADRRRCLREACPLAVGPYGGYGS